MVKRSGSKGSRSERRAGKQRAQRARAHGLPERREALPRARASTPEPGSRDDGDDRSSDAPPAGATARRGIPTLVKVVGGALVILVGVYILSQRREQALSDTKPAPELPSAQVTASAESPTTAVPRPEPEPEAEPSASAVVAPAPASEPTPIVSVTPPTKPLIAMPVVSAPALPKVPKPVIVAPAQVTAPKAPAPVVVAPVPVAPAAVPPAKVASPPAVAPKPAAPAAPAKPADNPY